MEGPALGRPVRFGRSRMVFYLLAMAGDESVKAILRMQSDEAETVLHEAVRLEDKDVVGMLLSADSQSQLAPVMGRIVNKQQTQSKPNEGFQLHRPELLIAAAHGDSDEIKRLLLPHREEDAVRQRSEVHISVDETVKEPAATALPCSEAVTAGGDTVLHVVASSGDTDKFMKCAAVIVGMANHLLCFRNRKGDSPMHCAARLRNARMVSHLLNLARAGDDTNDERDGAGDEAVKAILRMQNLKGETVLHEAVRLKDKEMIGELLSVDSQLARVPLTDGASSLYLALSLGHRDIAQLLFEKDKELSYSGPDGQNAFHAATQWKLGEEAIKMLFERNKDLIKQADRYNRWTPLHMAALFGETRVTELLLSADLTPAYLPDSNGSFPIHLAASNGQPDNVLALLQKSSPGVYSKKQESGPGDSSKKDKKKSGHYCAQLRDGKVGRWLSRLAKSDSSKEQNSGPCCAQLRDGKGRTFLHVAVQDKSWAVVKYACQEQGKMFSSSVMNMQDNDGNTALHLAVEVGDICVVRDLVSIPEVKLNLKNNKGETPRELASIRYKQQGTHGRYSSTPSRIYGLLHDAAHLTAPRENILPRDAAHLTACPRENIILPRDAAHLTACPRVNVLPREIHNKENRSQSIISRTQIIGLSSAMLTAVTFAAAFAVPGGYRADGTPALAGQYAFDAFVVANTLAFISSGLSTIFLMFAGLGSEIGRRTFSLLNSVNLLACSARSLGAAFAFGMYAVLVPVAAAEATRFWTCSATVGALVMVEADWAFRAVKMVYSDKVVLVKRFGISRAWLWLAGPVLVTLMSELAPYILLSLLVGYRRVN